MWQTHEHTRSPWSWVGTFFGHPLWWPVRHHPSLVVPRTLLSGIDQDLRVDNPVDVVHLGNVRLIQDAAAHG